MSSEEAINTAPVRRGRRLEYLTIGWNLLEALISIGAGIVAGSIALIGFGVDSLIEVSSGAILLWRLFSGEHRERLALRFVGASLIALAVYIGFEAVKSLLLREGPDASLIGIIIAALSLLVMPILARAKRRVAVQINSQALVADSHQADICAYLSAILLMGLGLNAIGVVVGRPGGRLGDDSDNRQGGHRSVVGRNLLRRNMQLIGQEAACEVEEVGQGTTFSIAFSFITLIRP